jgi:hypothetical protein
MRSSNGSNAVLTCEYDDEPNLGEQARNDGQAGVRGDAVDRSASAEGIQGGEASKKKRKATAEPKRKKKDDVTENERERLAKRIGRLDRSIMHHTDRNRGAGARPRQKIVKSETRRVFFHFTAETAVEAARSAARPGPVRSGHGAGS